MQTASIERAVQHIASYGDTDVFPFPPENHVFHDRGTEIVQLLQTIHGDLRARLDVNTTTGESSMSPVGYTGFRWATQLDPVWNAYLLALVIELGAAIEAVRVGRNVVPSHRFVKNPTDHELFERDGYLAFEALSLHAAEQHTWVVTTDLADFYPRVYHHRLDNALHEAAPTSDIPERIMRLLGRWSGNKSYGLPVGGPAARLLSELLLNRTDRLLEVRGRRFVRYADDYRLFADSREDAHRALAELSELMLRNEGLALSKHKTRIMSRAEFISTVGDAADEEDEETELSLAQRNRRQRARELLGLSLRYDPYSPTAVIDYEALKEAVERIDIVDLFTVELSKPRIDPRLVRKLLRALSAAEPSAKASICSSLAQNLELLAPLIPQVLHAVRRVLDGIETETAEETLAKVAERLEADAHVFSLGVNRAYAFRLLAEAPPHTYEALFAQEFERAPAFIQRDIVIAMARWGATYWLSDKKTQYTSLHPWVKRAFLMASFGLGDEGRHWRQSIAPQLSPFDEQTRAWVSGKVQSQANWKLPL